MVTTPADPTARPVRAGRATPALPALYSRAAKLPPVRVIRCDCGFEAFGDGDDELVTGAQAHALNAHGIELSTETVLALARPKPPEIGA